MRHWLLVAVLAVLVCFVAMAYAEETGGAVYNSPNGEVCDEFIEFINEQEYIDHTHKVNIEAPDEVGIGIDLVVWQNEKKDVSVEIQEKYDLKNEANKVYAVAKVNIFEMFKNKEE